MLELFNNETDQGKLYINYPMIESIRYTNKLPDSDYLSYSVTREECHNFKDIAAKFSFYKTFDFILVDKRKKQSEEKKARLKQNWKHLQDQNVCKANYLCSGKVCYPESKDTISQFRIFENQLHKYVSLNPCSVAILNSFPLFLYDYFKLL